jgi:hypothetical protein
MQSKMPGGRFPGFLYRSAAGPVELNAVAALARLTGDGGILVGQAEPRRSPDRFAARGHLLLAILREQ